MSDSIPDTPTTVGVSPPANLTGAPPGPATGQHSAAPPPGAGPASVYPKADPAQLENLPDIVKRYAYCCVWRAEPRPGSPKHAKVPYDPKTGKRARPGDLGTFGSYAEAMAALAAGNYDGIVLVLVPEGYSVPRDRYYINNPALHLEAYIAGVTTKYVTVTGCTLSPGVDLLERGEQLTAVLEKYMLRDKPLASSPAPTQAGIPPADPAAIQAADQQLLATIMQTPSGPRLAALLAGDMAECGNDHSSADMSACNYLAAHTSDPDQIDRIIRGSALMRPKWDRKQSGSTYGRITIGKAIASAVKYRQEHGEPTPEQLQSVFVQAGPQGVPSSPQASPYVAGAAALTVLASQKPKCISAKELAQLQLPQTTYLVSEILPEGTTIFTGPSKARKSFEVLALALDIAAGVPHMKLATTQCGVLYLALEDSWGRIQGRMMGILAGRPVPDNIYLWTEAPSLDMGLLAALDEHLKQHPEVKLVIIDTFQRIRGAVKRGEGSYAADYREMSTLKNWALNRGVSILLVHHNRKMADPDAFNMISGTNGIMGSADTIWVITKDDRMTDAATLHITGRDVMPQELAIRFNDKTIRWESLGSAAAVQAKQAKHVTKDVEPVRGFPGPADGTEVDAVLVGVGFYQNAVIHKTTPDFQNRSRLDQTARRHPLDAKTHP